MTCYHGLCREPATELVTSDTGLDKRISPYCPEHAAERRAYNARLAEQCMEAAPVAEKKAKKKTTRLVAGSGIRLRVAAA